ncbi:3-oxoacyl-ACP synthase III family protein [Chitinophaga caseinilytica]|uniref:3-oxoacyl-ACP synthase III family protein n=1 Tax=Chitinophaga caseinilytica TaxID=2267521 RepID=UPI003C2BC69F
MPFINAISYYLPDQSLSNENLNEVFPDWSVDKISSKTGISNRHIAAKDEYTSDMAVKAAEKLFSEHGISPSDIDYILLCTQSPDYFLPTSSCIVQARLGVPSTSGALDFNLGCSGYIYGLNLAKGLILSEEAKNVLLITSETYSKYLKEDDKSVRTIFGDAAAATLISADSNGLSARVARFALGTDGAGAENLIVKNGGSRNPGLKPELFMNGPDIFAFTLKRVPEVINRLLEKNGMTLENIDLFIFHQANKYMLQHLQQKIGIPEEKHFIFLEDCGNTVSSTIPIAMHEALRQGRIKAGMNVLLCGFGVGLSWGATIIKY